MFPLRYFAIVLGGLCCIVLVYNIWYGTYVNSFREEIETLRVQPITNTASTENTANVTEKKKSLFVTVKWAGRLGNNMFQYASLLGIARREQRVPVLLDAPTLDSVTQLKASLSLSQHKTVTDVEGWKRMKEDHFGIWDPKFVNLPQSNIVIRADLQCWKYFDNVREDVLREFQFSENVRNQTDKIMKNVIRDYPKSILVGVHVRRGDFTSKHFAALGYSTPDVSFFSKAFSYMTNNLPGQNVTFIVVGDDLQWCRENLNFSNFTVIVMEPASPVIHLSVITRTSHVVMTGGTFSWWGAWLAGGWRNEGGSSRCIVVYYSGYPAPGSIMYAHFKKEDYFPEHWVGMQ